MIKGEKINFPFREKYRQTLYLKMISLRELTPVVGLIRT